MKTVSFELAFAYRLTGARKGARAKAQTYLIRDTVSVEISSVDEGIAHRAFFARVEQSYERDREQVDVERLTWNDRFYAEVIDMWLYNEWVFDLGDVEYFLTLDGSDALLKPWLQSRSEPILWRDHDAPVLDAAPLHLAVITENLRDETASRVQHLISNNFLFIGGVLHVATALPVWNVMVYRDPAACWLRLYNPIGDELISNFIFALDRLEDAKKFIERHGVSRDCDLPKLLELECVGHEIFQKSGEAACNAYEGVMQFMAILEPHYHALNGNLAAALARMARWRDKLRRGDANYARQIMAEFDSLESQDYLLPIEALHVASALRLTHQMTKDAVLSSRDLPQVDDDSAFDDFPPIS